jgi:uncharacterized protein YndB with AHSA1/START domain
MMSQQPIDEKIAAEIRVQPEVGLDSEDGQWVLTVRRTFRHDQERVWRMITEPELLALWSPIQPDRPLTTPGAATTRERPQDDSVDAQVLVADPPRLLVHRWGTHLLRWTVASVDDGSVLELRQIFDERSQASSYAAGWQICLGTFAATYDGVGRERVTGERAIAYGWQELRDQYDVEFEKS